MYNVTKYHGGYPESITEGTEMFLVIIRKTNIGNVDAGGSATVNIIDTTGSLECTLHTRQCIYAPNLTHSPTTTIIPSLCLIPPVQSDHG